MKLKKFDLNLFILFEEIYRVRNLTQVAKNLHLTQPTISNALARMRSALDDQLFVSTTEGMIPTPLAEDIISQVREALYLMELSVRRDKEFDPQSCNYTFRLSMMDLAALLITPKLLNQLSADAPNISIDNHYRNKNDLVDCMRNGEVDLAIEEPLVVDSDICHAPLVKQSYVCIVRAGHPIGNNRLTMEKYLGMKHIQVSRSSAGHSHIDKALNDIGHERSIVFQTDNLATALAAVKDTDFGLTLPWNWKDAEVKTYPVPFDYAQRSLHLYWHQRSDNDPKLIWFKEKFVNVCESLSSEIKANGKETK